MDDSGKIYLLSGDGHVVVDVGKHGRLDKESLVPLSCSTGNQPGTLLLARLNEAKDLVHLLLVHLGALFSLGVERVADDTFLGTSGALLDKLLVNAFLDEGARTGCAALALLFFKRQFNISE